MRTQGWDLGLEAWIWASRLGFEPQGWNLSLEARIGGGRTEKKKEKEKEEEEKISHMCESIGHFNSF